MLGTVIELKCISKVDVIFCGTKSGRAESGSVTTLKKINNNVIVADMDPFGSFLAQPHNLNESHPM